MKTLKEAREFLSRQEALGTISFRKDDDDTVVEILLNGSPFSKWYNEANVSQPEDLTWGRDIGTLYREAMALGVMIASQDASTT